MAIKWISESSKAPGLVYISVSGHRTAFGAIRLCVYFSEQAVEDFNLIAGDRLLFGIDQDRNRLAFRPTMFGGVSICRMAGRKTLKCGPTMPFENIPRFQCIEAEAVEVQKDHFSIPLEFDAGPYRVRQPEAPLRRAA